jgi:hypothetical protein
LRPGSLVSNPCHFQLGPRAAPPSTASWAPPRAGPPVSFFFSVYTLTKLRPMLCSSFLSSSNRHYFPWVRAAAASPTPRHRNVKNGRATPPPASPATSLPPSSFPRHAIRLLDAHCSCEAAEPHTVRPRRLPRPPSSILCHRSAAEPPLKSTPPTQLLSPELGLASPKSPLHERSPAFPQSTGAVGTAPPSPPGTAVRRPPPPLRDPPALGRCLAGPVHGLSACPAERAAGPRELR